MAKQFSQLITVQPKILNHHLNSYLSDGYKLIEIIRCSEFNDRDCAQYIIVWERDENDE